MSSESQPGLFGSSKEPPTSHESTQYGSRLLEQISGMETKQLAAWVLVGLVFVGVFCPIVVLVVLQPTVKEKARD